MSVAWIARIPFADGKRSAGAAAMAEALPRLRGAARRRGSPVHADANDPNVVWAYWRLATRDDIQLVYETEEILGMAKANLPLYAGRPEDFFMEDDAEFGGNAG